MPDPANPGSTPELVALVEWIDQEADRFEAAWRSGTPPALGDFLATATGTERTHLLKELVKIDLEHRWRHGDHRAVEDYLLDWPELCGPDGWLADDLIAGVTEQSRDLTIGKAYAPRCIDDDHGIGSCIQGASRKLGWHRLHGPSVLFLVRRLSA